MKKRHYYARRRGNVRQIYYVERLWELASEQRAFDMPVVLFNLDVDVWFRRRRATVRRLLRHLRRIEAADLSYPIILSESGSVMDGYHRLAKAVFRQYSTIRVVQFQSDPPPDEIHVFGEHVPPLASFLDAPTRNALETIVPQS